MRARVVGFLVLLLLVSLAPFLALTAHPALASSSGQLLRISYPSGKGSVSISGVMTGHSDGSVSAELTFRAKHTIVYDLSAKQTGHIQLASRSLADTLNRPLVVLGPEPSNF